MNARALPGGIAFGTIACVVMACGGGTSPTAETASSATSSKCPDLSKADEASAFDYAKEYSLSREAADKLKAAVLASMEISTLADKLDADLGISCAQIALDLGNKGEYRSGSEACAAAVKAMHDQRAKLGSKASTSLVARAPMCLADASLMTKCASICDSSVAAEHVKAECQTKAGRCDGTCEGTCEVKSGKCDGACSGTCEGSIKGTCGGRCKGTCDGRASSGPCAGTCVGTCERGPINGECKGTCSGSCKPKGPGICDGVCAGTCSVEVTGPKCAGEFKTPDVSTDCRARCELAVINQTECAPPPVGLVVMGAASHGERQAADAMKGAVDKSFPGLLKTLAEVGAEQGEKRVLNAQAVIEGARTNFKEMARSGGKASATTSEEQLTKCFDEPFKKASLTATAVKAELDQALGVRDEASK